MFRIAAWVGLVTAVYAVALTFMFPREMGPLPAGMRTPIIAFELARSRDEVETMFDQHDDYMRTQYVHAMDAGNHADFLFLVLYGLFFMVFSRALIETGGESARWGRRLAALPSAMDAVENMQLLAITNALGGDYAEALSRLALFTWLKWLGIAAIFGSWIPALWKLGTLARVTAGVAGFTVLMTVAALFTRGIAAELMGLGVALTLVSALTFAFRRPRA